MAIMLLMVSLDFFGFISLRRTTVAFFDNRMSLEEGNVPRDPTPIYKLLNAERAKDSGAEHILRDLNVHRV